MSLHNLMDLQRSNIETVLLLCDGVLEENFMTVKQAIGIAKRHSQSSREVIEFLENFVSDVITEGVLSSFISSAGAQHKVLVPSPPPAYSTAERAALQLSAMQQFSKKKICILGCGAMGSVYAAFFANAGHEIWAVDLWADHVRAINTNGLQIIGPFDGKAGVERVIEAGLIKATTDASEVGRGDCDVVLIATKANGVEEAAKKAKSLLKPDGVVVTIQNGLGAGDSLN